MLHEGGVVERCLNKSQGWFPLGFGKLKKFLQWKRSGLHFDDVLRSKLPVEAEGSRKPSGLFIDYGFSLLLPGGENNDDGSS